MYEKISIEEMMRKYFNEISMNSSMFDEQLELMFCNRKVKLDKLYEIFEEYGGFNEVKKLNLFSQVIIKLGLNIDTSNSSIDFYTSIKSLYDQYLKNFDIWYKEYLKDFGVKKSRISLRSKHQRKYLKPSTDSISHHLFEFAQQRANDIGMNSIFVSLASGLPNEIDTTLNVLIELTQYQNYCEILSKMKSLTYLLPAVVGVFQDSDENTGVNIKYLTNLPDMNKFTNYIKYNVKKRSTEYYSLLFKEDYDASNSDNQANIDKINAEVANTKNFFLIRIKQVLTILNNLTLEPFEIASYDPINKLLLLLIIICDEKIRKKCWKIFTNLTYHMKIDKNCTLMKLLIDLMKNALASKCRNIIIKTLRCIYNIITNSNNDISNEYFSMFDTSIIIELFSLCDAEITLHGLLSLQAITIKNPLNCPQSLIFNYVDMICNMLKNPNNFDPYFEERVRYIFGSSSLNTSSETKSKIKCLEEHKDIAYKWFDENYKERDEDTQSNKCLKLYEIFIDLLNKFSNEPTSYVEPLIIWILRKTRLYTVLLEGTLLTVDFANKSKLIQLFKYSCNTNTIYVKKLESHEKINEMEDVDDVESNEYMEDYTLLDTLYSIQILRLSCINKTAHDNSVINYTLNYLRSNSPHKSFDSEQFEELHDANYCDGVESIANKEELEVFIRAHLKEEARPNMMCDKRYALIIANIISNICYRDDCIRRYFQQCHLTEIIRKNELNKTVLSILGNILR